MSNAAPGSPGQLTLFSAARDRLRSRTLFAWLDQDCVLCGAGSAERLVCVDCERSLPQLASHCPRCAVPLPYAATCGECRIRPPAFERAAALYEYAFPVDRLVQRFKYAGDLAVGRWLAERLAERVASEPRPHLLVAPPLARDRLRERGFNQALELAKVVGTRIGVACAISGLARVHGTAPQPRLGRRARRANLEGAFRCSLDLRDRHVAIVDDVLTTGATADAFAAALRAAGAAQVWVWAVARTPDPRARS